MNIKSLLLLFLLIPNFSFAEPITIVCIAGGMVAGAALKWWHGSGQTDPNEKQRQENEAEELRVKTLQAKQQQELEPKKHELKKKKIEQKEQECKQKIEKSIPLENQKIDNEAEEITQMRQRRRARAALNKCLFKNRHADKDADGIPSPCTELAADLAEVTDLEEMDSLLERFAEDADHCSCCHEDNNDDNND